MKTSLNGVFDIITHEAIVLNPYYDSKGILTIGIGHTKEAGGIDPNDYWGKKLTIAEVVEVFRKDLVKFEDRVNKAFTVPLTQEQFDAAVSFDFNTNAIHKAVWVKTFNSGKKVEAIREIMNWSKPKEIIPRRTSEQELFAKGKYSNTGRAVVFEADANGKVDRKNAKTILLTEVIKSNVVTLNSTPKTESKVQTVPEKKQGFFDWLLGKKK